ncbi:MAG TPA: DegT/DnrJ/EryC1/StrS aminotransferase family protein [Bryobacteraceae bacterium]|nr:DegT/DnrJ/EryC1/StrS aminotransferase family protein [Bryobacteraceae bacterium]
MNVPYFRPSIGEQEKSAVNAVLNSGWLTTGQAVKRFEAQFAEYLGVPHAVAVNSCTAALHLALEATGIGPGAAVMVPTMTFAATAAVVLHTGGRPVLVDCDPATLCMDPDSLEAAIATWHGQETLKAIIPMHYGGQMADMDRLSKIASRAGLAVIEDAAHALPAFSRESAGAPWRKVGTTSPLSCFSFYANKCITTGEGGMVVSTDSELADRVRMMSLHGLSKSAWSRFESKGSWYYEIVAPGFKYNLTDVAAAIGCAQLENADLFAERRSAVAAMYTERLAGLVEFLETPTELSDRKSSWHIYPLRLRLERLTIDRAEFINRLKQAGITCTVHWMPLHLHPFYRQTYNYRASDYPVASAEWQRLISLPIFPSMSEQEVDYVCESIAAIVADSRRSALTRTALATGTQGD